MEVSGPHRPTEPEVYVKVHPRGLSCEVPPHHLPALLRQFALDLYAKKITLRYHTHEDLQEESYSQSDFSARLEQLAPFLKDQPVVIEYGSKTTAGAGVPLQEAGQDEASLLAEAVQEGIHTLFCRCVRDAYMEGKLSRRKAVRLLGAPAVGGIDAAWRTVEADVRWDMRGE